MDLVEEVEKKQEGFKSAHTQIENDFSKLKTDFNTFSACSKVVDEFEHGLYELKEEMEYIEKSLGKLQDLIDEYSTFLTEAIKDNVNYSPEFLLKERDAMDNIIDDKYEFVPKVEKLKEWVSEIEAQKEELREAQFFVEGNQLVQ